MSGVRSRYSIAAGPLARAALFHWGARNQREGAGPADLPLPACGVSGGSEDLPVELPVDTDADHVDIGVREVQVLQAQRGGLGELALDAQAVDEVGISVVFPAAAALGIDETDAGGAVEQDAGAQEVAQAAAHGAHPIDTVGAGERDIALDAVHQLARLPVPADLDAGHEAVIPPGIDVAGMDAAVEALPGVPGNVRPFGLAWTIGGCHRCPRCQAGRDGQCQPAAPPQTHIGDSPRVR